MALLEIRDLSIWFGDLKAVDGASLAVEPGEVLGIVGESGSGKSMLARAALGLLPDGARREARTLSLLGQDLLAAENKLPFNPLKLPSCRASIADCQKPGKTATFSAYFAGRSTFNSADSGS